MDLGPHSAFIVAAYTAFAVIVGGLIGWLILDGRRQAKLLADFEAKGVRRRSAPDDRKNS
jgi:heme exporter protein D